MGELRAASGSRRTRRPVPPRRRRQDPSSRPFRRPRSEDHEPAGDVSSVLAGLDHAGQPVEPGIGSEAPDRLDESRDDVKCSSSPLAETVAGGPAQRLRARFLSEGRGGDRRGGLSVVRAILASPRPCHHVAIASGSLHVLGLQGAADHGRQLGFAERLEPEDRRTAYERAFTSKTGSRWSLRSTSASRFHAEVAHPAVLVEAMDLVQNKIVPRSPPPTSCGLPRSRAGRPSRSGDAESETKWRSVVRRSPSPASSCRYPAVPRG